MYSLLYCEDIKEYYICKTKNVILEDDGVCLVAFRAKLVRGGCGKRLRYFITENSALSSSTVASKHNLQRIRKSLVENPFLYVQEADETEEVADNIVSMDLESGNAEFSDVNEDNKAHEFAEDDIIHEEDHNEEVVDNIVSMDFVPGQVRSDLLAITENASHNEIIEDNRTDDFTEEDADMSEEETTCDYSEMADLFITKQYVSSEISEDDKTTANKTENEDQKTKIIKLKTVPEKLQKETYICCFCKLKLKNFVKHMTTFHNNEEEVKKWTTLPRNSPERRRYVRKMKTKATNYLKLIDEMKNRHNLEERHTRKKSIIKPSNYLKLVLGSKLSHHKFKTIYSDDMFVLFGNEQCGTFNHNTQISTQLQVLANIFNKLLNNNPEIRDLTSVFHPENIQTFLNCQDESLRNYETRYLIKFGKFLVQYYTSKKDFQKKIDTEEAIKLLHRALRQKHVKNESPKKQPHVPIMVEVKELLHKTLQEKRVKNELPKKQPHVPIMVEVKEVKKEPETKTTVQEEKTMPHVPMILKVERIPKNETEQPEDTQKKPYPLREKARNYQRVFLQEQIINETLMDSIDEEEKFEEHSTSVILNNKRYFFCYFCEKLYANRLIIHLERMHAEEEEVKMFCSFPKGSIQRKQLIARICRKGKYKYNTLKFNTNVSDLMKKTRQQSHKQNNRKRNECVDEKPVSDVQDTSTVTNQKEKIDVQDINISNPKQEVVVQDASINEEETTVNENTNVEPQWRVLEEMFEVSQESKLEFKEDDSKELMCMLDEHVNCCPSC